MTAELTPIKLQSVPCPLCGSTRGSAVASMRDQWYALPGTFSVTRCDECRHEYLNPQPAAELLSDCYPATYAPHQPADSLPDGSDSSPAHRPWYLRYLPLKYVPGLRGLFIWLTDDRSQPVPKPPASAPEGNRAVELGCASGRYLAQLRELGWQVQGVELCAEPAAAAQAQGLAVHQGTLESAALSDASCDLAAAWMVIEHVPDPRETVAGFRRLLRSNGQLLFSVPNARCWQRYLFGRYWYGWDLPRHLQHFGPATIRALLQSSGFEDVRVIHQRTLLNMMGSIGLWLRGLRSPPRLADWFFHYPDQPRLLIQLMLAPFAIILSWLHQGERLTVTAVAAADGDAEKRSSKELR